MADVYDMRKFLIGASCLAPQNCLCGFLSDFRLRHKFSFLFSLNSLGRLGLAPARRTVPFLVEGAVPPTTGAGKLEITAGSQEPDASSSTASFTTLPKSVDCSRGKTTPDFRDMAGEEFRLLFPFFLTLSAGKRSEMVTFGRGNVFPQISHESPPQPCTHVPPRMSDKTRYSRRSTLDD